MIFAKLRAGAYGGNNDPRIAGSAMSADSLSGFRPDEAATTIIDGLSRLNDLGVLASSGREPAWSNRLASSARNGGQFVNLGLDWRLGHLLVKQHSSCRHELLDKVHVADVPREKRRTALERL